MKTFLVFALFLPAVLCGEKKVEEFRLQVSENGATFEEVVEVNTEAQIVVYKFPAHTMDGETDVMNDFKRRLTVHRFHDIQTCYVSRLQQDEPSPEELKESLKKDATLNKRLPVTVVSRQWIPKERFPAYLLSKEALNFCADYPVYRVEQPSADALLRARNSQGRQHQRKKKTNDLL